MQKESKRTRTTLVNGPHKAVMTEIGIEGATLVITMAKSDGGVMHYINLYSSEEQALVTAVLRALGWSVSRTEVLEEEIVWEDSITAVVDCDPAEEVEL